ncbi:hypothetical protein R3Q06_35720 [Rhodococcus erythropolis]|uniref:hypothetical protein n=1 Tax=Rhodococcus erythropolis TaxID=1833 RepID=UPI002949B926|nr:hypothetical protein [Rhodococcus erythropolis]MDV6278720.1 hypothetical protein [Rhodococcus erythropolis]
MTVVSTKMNRPYGMRRWTYAALVAAVTSVTVCSGAGTGSASAGAGPDAVTTSVSAADTAPGSAVLPGWVWWSFYNDTGQPIYGEWSEQVGDTVSVLNLVKNMPLRTEGHESRKRVDDEGWFPSRPYWMGHICYNHAWWNFPRSVYTFGSDAVFRLQVVNGGLQATLNPAYAEHPSEKVSFIRNPYEAPC